MKILSLILMLSVMTGTLTGLKAQVSRMNIRVDANTVTHQMKGGIGASWHAMIDVIPLENEKYVYKVLSDNSRGSAFAGNPPVSDPQAWKQLYHHAQWLGLDFIRVELSQRMYEPEKKNVFDWNNDEMKALYKILDWCEANHADVFLQQMWAHVAWNALPGVHPLISIPKSLDDWSEGIATLLQYLTQTKKYTCIKYFSIANEPPGGGWGYWWSNGEGTSSLTPAWKKVREAVDAKGIHIPLSGPDWTSLPPFDSTKIDFNDYIGSYDIHSYYGISNSKENEVILKDWTQWAHRHNKPFFLAEFGNMNLGWKDSNPGPKSFAAALSNASDVVYGMNIGVDAFNRWSFINRGDLDGQWQLVRTYDIEKKSYTKDVTPENTAYYGFAMLSRFLGKYASTLEYKTDDNIEGVKQTVYRNTDGNLVVLFVNNRKNAVNVNLTMKGVSSGKAFHLYQVTDALVSDPGFRLDPVKKFTGLNKTKEVSLLPESITVLTTYQMKQEDMGVIK